MKMIGRTVLTAAIVYLLWAALVLIPGWFPSLPAFPRLPSLDPQDVLASIGLVPQKILKVLEENRASPQNVLDRAKHEVENLRSQFEKEVEERGQGPLLQAKDQADLARQSLDRERKNRERDLKQLEKALRIRL